MNKKIKRLKDSRDELKKQICDNLEFLMGTINRSPAMMNYSLTTKVGARPYRDIFTKDGFQELKR